MATPDHPTPREAAEPAAEDRRAEAVGLAKIAGTAALHTGGWALRGYLRAGRRVAEAALSPREALKLAREVQQGTEEVLLAVINASEVGQRMSANAAPAADAARRVVADVVGTPPERDEHHDAGHGRRNHHPEVVNGHAEELTLIDEGEELLRRSRDVRYEVDAHPAYERIMSELAPDEARVLRLLLLEGPQAAVDIRTGGPLGLMNSRLIAPGISMIGARSGCRYVERVPSYLNNLFRLGLIWFSRETLRDHMKYQVLEAQPEVLGAIHSVRAAKVVRRSIHLTPFGEDFCRVSLLPDTAVLAELPAHADPPEDRKTASPPIESGDS